MEKTPADIPGPPGSEGLAGVGLFFQQSPKQGIFVASVTPGCAGARTGCIKVERNVQQTLLKEDLDLQLTRTEKSCSAMEADIQALVNHPTIKVEDGRTKELAHELKCRMEDLRRLQATQIRVEERCRELEKRKIETQERLERERSERLKAEAMERDRASSSNDLQRGHQDEAALAASVLDKLRNDVKLEIDQRQQAEEALAQAMADFHDMKAQMLDLRLRQQRLRRVISVGHETLEKALRLNQGVYSDLSAIVPSMDQNQNTFLNDLLAAVRNHDNYPPPMPSLKLSLAGYPGGAGNLAYSGGGGGGGEAHAVSQAGVVVGYAGGSNLHTNNAGMMQAPFQTNSPFSAWNHAPSQAGVAQGASAPANTASPSQGRTGAGAGPTETGALHTAGHAGSSQAQHLHGNAGGHGRSNVGSAGGVIEGAGGAGGGMSGRGDGANGSKLDVDSIARKYGLQITTTSPSQTPPRRRPAEVTTGAAGHVHGDTGSRQQEALV